MTTLTSDDVYQVMSSRPRCSQPSEIESRDLHKIHNLLSFIFPLNMASGNACGQMNVHPNLCSGYPACEPLTSSAADLTQVTCECVSASLRPPHGFLEMPECVRMCIDLSCCIVRKIIFVDACADVFGRDQTVSLGDCAGLWWHWPSSSLLHAWFGTGSSDGACWLLNHRGCQGSRSCGSELEELRHHSCRALDCSCLLHTSCDSSALELASKR